ncbi:MULTISPECIES: cation:proton antiporter domain-containing protein [unclassified Streptomyces]|uniref:cation:proton antiporter domain-containing protein n=1 Tax=unclassified Streptomyces TaxID=2593676 RepID=UPI002E33A4CE|nr:MULTISPECIES: cation:proton antiporter [unclassified Streptomyces]WUC69130.1 cation:proton antiporter [Streptomyces sp. NBC_00539]
MAGDPLTGVLIAVPVVLLLCGAGAVVMRRCGQPAVVGEIAVGILLGPSLLGWVWPQGQGWLLPAGVLPYLGVLGNLGLVVFMFLVGFELDLGLLRGRGRVVAVVGQASVVVPLALGGLLAAGMYGSFAPDGVGRGEFVLFVAVAMSVTAFPVLARILTEQGLNGTPVGAVALASAAVADVVAWCLLAVVVAVAGGGGVAGAAVTGVLAGAFLAGMWWGVRPVLARCAKRWADAGGGVVGLFAGLCGTAYATDALGVHALFGAFVCGAVVPRDWAPVEGAARRMGEVVVPVLLPLFFVGSGLRTDVGRLGGDAGAWLWAGAVLVVAVAAKWGGGAGAALVAGQPVRDAVVLGALLNCRGVTELVVLNVGLGLGVIGPELFTVLVLMAVVTTALTGPVVRRMVGGNR